MPSKDANQFVYVPVPTMDLNEKAPHIPSSGAQSDLEDGNEHVHGHHHVHSHSLHKLFSWKRSNRHESQQHCDDVDNHVHGHNSSCRNSGKRSRLRMFIFMAAFVLTLLLVCSLAYGCISHEMAAGTTSVVVDSDSGSGASSWLGLGLGTLLKRQSDGSGGSGGESVFVRDKLYLIVLFVGIVVVIILGIMLSFWCCKGAFENPCCCPCYLCACCGGLACLECIGCGLCAEAAGEM